MIIIMITMILVIYDIYQYIYIVILILIFTILVPQWHIIGCLQYRVFYDAVADGLIERRWQLEGLWGPQLGKGVLKLCERCFWALTNEEPRHTATAINPTENGCSMLQLPEDHNASRSLLWGMKAALVGTALADTVRDTDGLKQRQTFSVGWTLRAM